MSPESTKVIELDENRQVKARKLASIKRRLFFIDLILPTILLLGLLLTGWTNELSEFTNLSPPGAAGFYFIILFLVYWLVSFPLNYFRYRLSRMYCLSKQSFRDWLFDSLKSRSLSLILGAALIALVYWLIIEVPQLWWLVTWIFILMFSLVLSFLAPQIISLFFVVKPLEDGELKNRIVTLAQRIDIHLKGIYIVGFDEKTTVANAALMGFGNIKRIVLSDTLIDNYKIDEIEVIVGHELGHQKHNDIWRLFVIQAVVLLVLSFIFSLAVDPLSRMLGFGNLSNAANLPLVLILTGFLVTIASPLINSIIRQYEIQADRFSLWLTGNPTAFKSAITRLVNQNLIEAYPPQWVEQLLEDHPAYQTRIKQADMYEGLK
jgi:STE24 endopeptidase